MAAKRVKKVKSTSVKNQGSLEIIRKRAHEIYLKRIKKGIEGDADADWLQAEKELMN
jgi:hypothetical protein